MKTKTQRIRIRKNGLSDVYVQPHSKPGNVIWGAYATARIFNGQDHAQRVGDKLIPARDYGTF